MHDPFFVTFGIKQYPVQIVRAEDFLAAHDEGAPNVIISRSEFRDGEVLQILAVAGKHWAVLWATDTRIVFERA